MLQRARDPGRVDRALRRQAALAIERLAHHAEHVIVEQRIAGPGIAGDQGIGAVDIGDVGDAADIDHDDRPLALQRLRQRAVIDRHKRRALPAGGDVGGAEIMHDRDMDGLGQRRRVADLHGQSLRSGRCSTVWPWKPTISMSSRGDAVLRGKGGDSLGMRQGDGALGLAQDARPRIALRQIDGLGQRLAQQAAFHVGVGPVAGRPERLHPLAVGFDQGDIDPVERGAAHQTDRRQHHRHGAFVTPCSDCPADDAQLVSNRHIL